MCPERRGHFEKEAGSISPLFERLEDRILLSAFSESLYALADDVDTSFTSVPTLNVELTINETPSESVSAIFSEVSLDLAIDDILIEWQAAFPGQDYVVWEKDAPWDSLDQVQALPAGVTELQNISLDIGRNEYESTSFVITNLTGGNLTFDLAHDSTQIDITLRKGI